MFQDKRVKGEWFALSESDVLEADSLVNDGEGADNNLNYELSLLARNGITDYCVEYTTHNGVDLFPIKVGLSANARLLYDFIKQSTKMNSTPVFIDKVEFMRLANIKTNQTYDSAILELKEAEIIADTKSKYVGWYWTNPVFFFKGNRDKFFQKHK